MPWEEHGLGVGENMHMRVNEKYEPINELEEWRDGMWAGLIRNQWSVIRTSDHG